MVVVEMLTMTLLLLMMMMEMMIRSWMSRDKEEGMRCSRSEEGEVGIKDGGI